MADTTTLEQASAEQLLEAQKTGVVIIDIRREDEWASTGIIEGAKPITAFTETGELHTEFLARFAEAVPSTDTEFLIYCRSGQRTTNLGNMLISQLGFTEVAHLSGGMMGWLSSGLDTVPHK